MRLTDQIPRASQNILDMLEQYPESSAFRDQLMERDGVGKLIKMLPEAIDAADFVKSEPLQKMWEHIGLFYFHFGRRDAEALSIFDGMYQHMLLGEKLTNTRAHKGTPLLWIAESFSKLGFELLRKRYLMVTLCEDAITNSGAIPPDKTGVYFRLVWRLGMSDAALRMYAEQAYALSQNDKYQGRFPERILQLLDNEWMTDVPATTEANVYFTNRYYIRTLLNDLGDSTGQTFEELAEYLLLCMPGCRTSRRANTYSTDFDVVCSMTGFDLDFRSELGRYFVCECKDWSKSAGFEVMAKFCRVLDSVKAKFGVIFSKNGISGEKNTTDAARERLKIFQDRGIIIIDVDAEDIEYVANGGNFIGRLRKKYETIRLDLFPSA